MSAGCIGTLKAVIPHDMKRVLWCEALVGLHHVHPSLHKLQTGADLSGLLRMCSLRTDSCRFEEARGALFKALDSRELFGVPLLVLANKQDLQDAQPPEALQQMLGLDELKVPFR